MNNAAIDSRAFNRRLLQIALPIAFQSLMLAAVAAADALMLGRVAQNEMTAVSLATQIQFVQNMFVMAITAAGAILGAQYFGKGDHRTMSELFSLMLRFSGLVSLLFFGACELIPETLMRIFTHDEPLILIGAAYLRIAGWSYMITGVSMIEIVFAWPDMGRLMLDSITKRDYPTLSAIYLLLSISVAVMMIIVDLVYAWIDPRIRVE